MILLFALSLLAQTAAADGNASTAAPPTPPVKVAKVKKPRPKLICKTDRTSVGSNIPKSTCKTAEEWAADQGSGFDGSVRGNRPN